MTGARAIGLGLIAAGVLLMLAASTLPGAGLSLGPASILLLALGVSHLPDGLTRRHLTVIWIVGIAAMAGILSYGGDVADRPG